MSAFKIKDRTAETSSNTPGASGTITINLSGTGATLNSVLMRTLAAAGYVTADIVPLFVEQTNDATKWCSVEGTFTSGSPNTITFTVAGIIDGSAGAAASPAWTSTVNIKVAPIAAHAKDTLIARRGFMFGFDPVWVSATTLGASAGACHVEGTDSILVAHAAPANLVPSSPTASTWYHIYIYDNAGTPTLEAATTAPVAYATPTGTAYSKTGNATRRYLYSALTDGSSNFFRFGYSPSIKLVSWLGQLYAAPYRALSGGSSTSAAVVSCAGAAPLTARTLQAKLINASASQTVFVATGDVTVSNSLFNQNTGATQVIITPLSCSATQTVNYLLDVAGGSVYIDVIGWYLER